MRFVLVILQALLGMWLLVGGVWALATDTYMAPAAGGDPAQLGQWVEAVEAAGMDPLGLPVRVGHVVTGIVALAAAYTMLAGWGTLAWVLGYLAALALLWYVPWGTAVGLLTLASLSTPSVRISVRGR